MLRGSNSPANSNLHVLLDLLLPESAHHGASHFHFNMKVSCRSESSNISLVVLGAEAGTEIFDKQEPEPHKKGPAPQHWFKQEIPVPFDH
jgi:hypothetical protein